MTKHVSKFPFPNNFSCYLSFKQSKESGTLDAVYKDIIDCNFPVLMRSKNVKVKNINENQNYKGRLQHQKCKIYTKT